MGRLVRNVGWMPGLWLVMAVFITAPAAAQEAEAGARADETPEAAAPTASDGPVYEISRFVLSYVREHPDQPAVEELMRTPVTLTPTEQGYIAPRSGAPTETRPLADYGGDEPRRYYASAVQRVLEALSDRLIGRRYLGVYVAPDPLDITETGQDVRAADRTELRIVIVIGAVSRVRTLAGGDRIEPERRVDHPLHERVGAESPIRPYEEGEPERRDLMRKDTIDRYAMVLSRHPGRRVDVAVSPSAEVGGVNLDYLITETKPWLAYAQLSNTGTRNTKDLREQFGFRHYQLTNNDDILSVDYATAGFDASHAVLAAYDSRLMESNYLRYRVFGGWSEYTASDVGFFDDTFEGESYHIGGELLWTFYQDGPLFLDVGGGARFEHQEVSNTLPGSFPGEEEFVIPYLTVRAERVTDLGASHASVTLEWQSEDINGIDRGDLSDLGRAGVDEDWLALKWEASQSLFLEPLLNREAWEDPGTPESSTLAHELYLGVRGQSTFGDRVIPQHEMVAGGLHTVRGYEESVVAGDTVVIGTAEYRYHVPRALALAPEPGELFGETFRFSPQQVYGPTDWDLILRAFIDAGHVVSHSGGGFSEDSETLVGAGVGFEVQYRRNLTFRLDYGVALREIDGRVDDGSQQVHFSLTLLY